MNVTCNKCGKRYVISDDKVAGKSSVKIRCKQCQNLISVAVPGATGNGEAAFAAGSSGISTASSITAVAPASSSPSRPGGVVPSLSPQWDEDRTRAMPPMDTSAQWFAMIAGKQQGPFDVGTLQAKVGLNEVTLRTYLWKPGMEGWKRAADVPEVSPIFAGVSVGATATGPTQAAPQTQKPAATRRTGQLPAVQRDVALANETPSPEVTNRRATNAAAEPVRSSPSRPPTRSQVSAVSQPTPAPRKAEQQPLNDLFSDVPQPSEQNLKPVSSEHQVAEKSTSGQLDPFAQLGPASDSQLPPPGEATKFFIAQAGVNKRNPPWKIALFVLSFIVAPLSLIYILNTFQIVKLPTVTVTNERGEEVQESFFSSGGIGGLKDMLTGEAKRKRAEAEQKRLAAQQAAAIKAKQKPAADTEEPEPQAKPVDPALAALYNDTERVGGVGPKKRKEDGEGSGGAEVNKSGLSPEVVAKTVADKSKAFNLCIEEALRRNPNLKVGNITLVLTVGKSGAVKAASVEPKQFENSDWAQCMTRRGKGIMFPASDGDTDVELPFKIGVAM